MKKINQNQAIELINQNKFDSSYTVEFDNNPIDAFDAIKFGKYSIDVPNQLIRYNDEQIDYSDIPAIIDEDIETGKIKWLVTTQIPLEPEINQWLKKENVDLNDLITKLINNFYQTMKSVQKNVAI